MNSSTIKNNHSNSSTSTSNPFNQITNANPNQRYQPHSFQQPRRDGQFQEQHPSQPPSKSYNLFSRNLADVPRDITMESSLDSSRSSIHSNTNFNPSIKTRKGKAKEGQGGNQGGLTRSTSLTTSNGFFSNEDDSEDDGGYHVDLDSIRRVKEEEEEQEQEQGEKREVRRNLGDEEYKGIGSSNPQRKESWGQQTVKESEISHQSQKDPSSNNPFSDEQQEKKDPLSSRAFSSASSHPPQSYKEAKEKANGMLGSVRGSNVSLGKKGGAQAIDGYLNLSVSRHGLVRTFALPPSSIKTLSYSSLTHLLEMDLSWEQSRWAQLPLGNGKRAKREPGKSVFENFNPLGKNSDLSVWVEHPVRSGEWKKVEEWKAESSARTSKSNSSTTNPSSDLSESHSLVSVLMRGFWNERLKVSGYTHLTIRASRDGPPGAARLRTTSTASSSSLPSKLKRRDGSNLSTSSSRTTLGNRSASEGEEVVEFEPQPNGLERVGRHLSRLSVSLASLFGALDVAAERGGRDSDRENDLDPEALGYVNVEEVSDEETDGQRSGLRRRIGRKVKRIGSSNQSIRENGHSNRTSTSSKENQTSGALGLLVQILPAPLLRFSGLSRFKSSLSSKKSKRFTRSTNLDPVGNGFTSIQSDVDSDVDNLSLHTCAGLESNLETDLDADAKELDASEITSNSSKIRKLFKTPLSDFNSDTEGESSSIGSFSRKSFKVKGKKHKKSGSGSSSIHGFSENDTDGSGWAGGDSQKQASVLRKAVIRRKNSQTSQNENKNNGGFWKAMLGTRLGTEAEKRESVDNLERDGKENLKQRKWKSPREIQTSIGKSGFNERLDIDSPDKLRFSCPLPPIQAGKGSTSADVHASSFEHEGDGDDSATIATSRALSSYEALAFSTPSTIKASSLKKRDQRRPPLPDLNLINHGRSSTSTTQRGSTSPTAVSTNGSYRSKKTVELEEDPFRSQPPSIVGRLNSNTSPNSFSSSSNHQASLFSGKNESSTRNSFDPSTPKNETKTPSLKRTASLDTITQNVQDSGFSSGDKKGGKSKPSAWRFKLNRESVDGYASASEETPVPASPSGGSLLRLGRRRSNSSSSSLDLSNGKTRRGSFSKNKGKEESPLVGATVVNRPEDAHAGMRWAGEGQRQSSEVENHVNGEKRRMVLD